MLFHKHKLKVKVFIDTETNTAGFHLNINWIQVRCTTCDYVRIYNSFDDDIIWEIEHHG